MVRNFHEHILRFLLKYQIFFWTSYLLHQLFGEDKCKPGKRRTDGKTRHDLEKRWTSDTYCEDHKDVSVDDKVLFFIFPNSKISDLSPSNAVAKINAEALKRFENLKDNRQGVIQLNQPQSGQSFAVNTAVTFCRSFFNFNASKFMQICNKSSKLASLLAHCY
jgi:hypothetical protein